MQNSQINGLNDSEGKRRDRMGIMADILNTVPARKTKIMYRCNLSFKQLNGYLESMVVEFDLLEIDKNGGSSISYKPTPKGKRFLTNYMEIKQLLTPGN